MYALTRKWLELTENFELLSILDMSRYSPEEGKPEFLNKRTKKVISYRALVSECIKLKLGKPRLTLNFKFIDLKFEKYFKFLGVPHLHGVRSDYALGRLSFKEEAAGKLRVFAMVDSWTQSIMKPLHDLLFQVLLSIPNDATFNQGSAFKRAVKKAKESGHSYGFDLSAATDRLPLIIQIRILSGIIGNHLASL